jgi:hypothetical protein
MARLGRYFVAGQALHVIQRGDDHRRIGGTERVAAIARPAVIARPRPPRPAPPRRRATNGN